MAPEAGPSVYGEWANAALSWEGQPPDEIWQANDIAVSEGARQVVLWRQTWRRNGSAHPFLVASQHDQAEKALSAASDWAARQGWTVSHRLGDLPAHALALLRERTVLPWRPISFPQVRPLKALVFPPSGLSAPTYARLGEEEHLQIVQARPGWQAHALAPEALGESWENDRTPFAFSQAYGFLTSNPAWVGPALQIEALLHLPALTAHRRIAQVHEGLRALGLLFYPEPMGTLGGGDAGYFRVSSRGGLGLDAGQVRTRFNSALLPLLLWEKKSRDLWWRKDALMLKDRIRRSHHMLLEAQLLPLHEAIGFGSMVRLGLVLGEIDKAWLGPMERIRVLAQNGHLGESLSPESHGDGQENERRQDARRAERVRLLATRKAD